MMWCTSGIPLDPISGNFIFLFMIIQEVKNFSKYIILQLKYLLVHEETTKPFFTYSTETKIHRWDTTCFISQTTPPKKEMEQKHITRDTSTWIPGDPCTSLVCSKGSFLITQSRIYSGAQPIVFHPTVSV